MARNALNATWLFALAATAAGCDGGGNGGGGGGATEPPPILRLEIVSGDGQAAYPGLPLAEPLVVRVTRGDAPATQVAIRFSSTAGTLDGTVRTTDHEGRVDVRWTAPAEDALEGARVTARPAAAAGDSVAFRARPMRQDEMTLALSEDGLPVELFIYRRGAFNANTSPRFSFSDSAHLPPAVAAAVDIAAFTPGRAPLLLTPGSGPGRDTVRIRFATEPLRIPLTVWIVQPPYDSTRALVEDHLEGVRDAWGAQAGIVVEPVRIVDATAFPGAGSFQGEGPLPSCDATKHVVIGWDEEAINAYYIGQVEHNGIVGSAGYCSTAWIEVFPLAHHRWNTLLAHEIGHGFLGGHHETIPDNIMHFRGEGRRLSEGQRFQAHYSSLSILNSLFDAHPPELRRPCVRAGSACPGTAFTLH